MKRFVVCIVLALLLLPGLSWGAVVVVSTAEVLQATLAASKTQSVTVSAGSDRCLVVPVAFDLDGRTVSGITFNGSENFVKKSDHTYVTGAPSMRTEFWYLINPTVTTANVVISIAGGTARFAGAVFAVTGCHQTTPLGTAVTSGSGTANASVTVADGATGDLVIDLIQDGAGDADPVGAGQTQVGYTVLDVYAIGTSYEAGAASVAMSWTNTAAERHLAAINIFQASGSPPPADPPIGTFNLLGVGT